MFGTQATLQHAQPVGWLNQGDPPVLFHVQYTVVKHAP